MMNLTDDQYVGLYKLQAWYRKQKFQYIEISGTIGTGALELVREFISNSNLDDKEVMYLSYDQHQVLELAFQKYHSYYLNRIYNYTKIVDFNSLPVINRYSREVSYRWKKKLRSKIDPKYKLMVVFDSSLLNYQTLKDLSTFGVPIILLKDPGLLPAPDSYTFFEESNIELYDINDIYRNNPIVYIAHKVLVNDGINHGNYDTVSVIGNRQMNLYNLKSSDMNITLTDDLSSKINDIYRGKILHKKDDVNSINERVICMDSIYNRKITNQDNSKVKIYLTKGTVGTISKINKHTHHTRYIPIEFKPDYYHESFDDLYLDRYYLNDIDEVSNQLIPDDIILLKHAYSLPVYMTRVSHWDKVTIIADDPGDDDLYSRLLYTAITRANKSINLIKT